MFSPSQRRPFTPLHPRGNGATFFRHQRCEPTAWDLVICRHCPGWGGGYGVGGRGGQGLELDILSNLVVSAVTS